MHLRILRRLRIVVVVSQQSRPTAQSSWPVPVVGGKYVRLLDDLLQKLRPQDAHGNRILFLDDVLVCYLLAFFNPSIRSLRTVEDFSQTRQAQRHLSVDRIPRSTLSDFHRVSDPSLLQPIAEMLRKHAKSRMSKSPRVGLPETLKRVIAVDGSFFEVAADVAWALHRRNGEGKHWCGIRVDVHVDVSNWLPEVISVADNESEVAHAKSSIVDGAIHVYDRGFFSFELIKAHYGKANFVLRMREPGPRTPRFETERALQLSNEDRKAGVISDSLGTLAGSTHRRAPVQKMREIVIASSEVDGAPIRLITDLTDVPVHIIGTIYRQRWQVELFFRWLKSCARFRDLWSHERSGAVLQFYTSFIAMLLMYLHTGTRPSKYALILTGMVIAGTATLEEIQPIIARRQVEREQERGRRAKKRAKQTSG